MCVVCTYLVLELFYLFSFFFFFVENNDDGVKTQSIKAKKTGRRIGGAFEEVGEINGKTIEKTTTETMETKRLDLALSHLSPRTEFFNFQRRQLLQIFREPRPAPYSHDNKIQNEKLVFCLVCFFFACDFSCDLYTIHFGKCFHFSRLIQNVLAFFFPYKLFYTF